MTRFPLSAEEVRLRSAGGTHLADATVTTASSVLAATPGVLLHGRGANGKAGCAGISRGIVAPMAMTLRLDDQETDALRRRAELEGRSMQEVARQAVRDYIERTSKRELLDRILDEELPRYAEALDRLGQ